MNWQTILIDIITKYNRFVLGYLTFLNIIYTFILFLSFWGIFIHLKRIKYGSYYDMLSSDFIPPISVLVPCYNEESTIVENINSLLSLEYSEFEVIVINDGSKDNSLIKLIDTFKLEKIDMIYEKVLNTEPIREIYISSVFDNLIVVDKENGGKSDALNAGINIAKFPLFTAIDADSILEKNSLVRIVRPFVEDPIRVVAAGGIVRIANGSTIKKGFIEEIGLSKSGLAVFQTVEYIRAFLSGRVGWSELNGLMIVSGAFGVFKKNIAQQVGGYTVDTIGEDMELVVKIHDYMKRQKRKYKVVFIPDPVCWTQGPEDLKSLSNQRIRWHRGLIDSLLTHWKMLFNPRYGFLGMVIVPYYWFFEMFGPFVEITGYITVILSFVFGILNGEFAILFFIAAVLYGIFISLGSILLEEYSFRRYENISDFLKLVLYSVLENFGYRQLTSWWRFKAFFGYKYKKNKWGSINRKKF
ncbi:glycosyltransferase family 2 protein [Brassicibacter mesophilus]|uniref:glycosyltransferase family 2 protein n=1 Tax=Brassicibacter mesophilus TaxID=745119 RepID=UPI003D231D43